MIRDVAVVLGAFVLMEPATYAAHRWVMHGVGWALHHSHHRAVDATKGVPWRNQLEANDAYPVMFAAVAILAMAAGTRMPALAVLVPAAVGVTMYGAAYAFVHDIYIHGRFARIPVLAPLEHLRDAHALHHRFGGEPYGMLCPIVPRALREQSAPTRPVETADLA